MLVGANSSNSGLGELPKPSKIAHHVVASDVSRDGGSVWLSSPSSLLHAERSSGDGLEVRDLRSPTVGTRRNDQIELVR